MTSIIESNLKKNIFESYDLVLCNVNEKYCNIFKIEENQCMMLNSFDLNDICVDRRFLICACAYLLTHYTLYLVEIQQTKEKETKRERERERNGKADSQMKKKQLKRYKQVLMFTLHQNQFNEYVYTKVPEI
jgi:hypothetical protein